jgi:ribosomal protein S18 acetylase RimI-like enzyme
MPFTIRPVVLEDAPALSRICLLTGDAGQSAEHLHRHCELPGLVWALPYVSLPSETARTWGFVLVDETALDDGGTTKAIKGYVVGTSDTRAYEAATEAEWWPSLRNRFSLSSNGDGRTKADQEYIDLIHRTPDVALDACLAVSPAHMHINLLPEVQRRGWGRKLIGRVVEHLREEGIDAMWLGINERNTAARTFYEKLGFWGIKGAPSELMALDFETWKGVEWASGGQTTQPSPAINPSTAAANHGHTATRMTTN